MGLLSEETVSVPGAGFADGIEFEETFPDAAPTLAPKSAVAPSARAPKSAVVPSPPAHDPTEAVFQERLDRRLHEAETMVKQTIERMRLEEEQRLAAWVQERRAEEQRRLAKWVDERRAAVEHSAQQRATEVDGLAERLERMLVAWQEQFEQRLEQRRIDEESLAERRRQSDEERLRAWRADLEHALTERCDRRASTDRTPQAESIGEVRTNPSGPFDAATSARDLGRLLRDRVAELTNTSAFAVAVHSGRDEVAYRYRVASDDEVGGLLRRDALDDGPQGAVAHMDGWARAQRTIRVGSRNVTVHTAQHPLSADGTTIGVVTLQSEAGAIADDVLARVAELAAAASPRLAQLREVGSFRGV